MAKLKLFITPRAELDIKQIAIYIAHDKKDVAGKFLDNFWKECCLLQKMPEIGKLVNRNFPGINQILENTRSWPIKNFRNYLIFYKKTKNEILILRVLNVSRDLPSLFYVNPS